MSDPSNPLPTTRYALACRSRSTMPEQEWLEVQISGLQDLHRPVPTSEETDDLPTVKVTVAAPYISSYGLREGGGDTEREFYPCSDGFCETGDAVTFPTIGIVVAHLILRPDWVGTSSICLSRPYPAGATCNGPRSAARPR